MAVNHDTVNRGGPTRGAGCLWCENGGAYNDV